MQELEKKIEVSYLKKKGLIAERKEVKLEVQEAARYSDMLQEMVYIFHLIYLSISNVLRNSIMK